jgi:hypothetical protein
VLGRSYYGKARIVQPGERRRRLIIGMALTLAGLLVTSWLAFDYGRQRAGYFSDRSEARIDRLQQRLDRVTRDRNLLRSQVAVLERSSQIDREAARGVRGQLGELEEANVELEEQLAFLRGILKSDDQKGGLRVHDLAIEALPGDRRYRFAFTVSQVMQNAGAASGRIQVYVGGILDGEALDLDLADLTDGDESLKMSFRYFQNVSGVLQLPEGFQPKRFVVNVKPTSESHASVTQVFDWVVGG